MVQTPTMPVTPGRAAGPFSLPNLLTYGRILAVPAIVACYLLGSNFGRWLALFIFIAASITDFLDGYLARLWHQQSAIGRMLDPIADKLLVATSLNAQEAASSGRSARRRKYVTSRSLKLPNYRT